MAWGVAGGCVIGKAWPLLGWEEAERLAHQPGFPSHTISTEPRLLPTHGGTHRDTQTQPLPLSLLVQVISLLAQLCSLQSGKLSALVLQQSQRPHCVLETYPGRQGNNAHDCPWSWGHLKRPTQEGQDNTQCRTRGKGPSVGNDLESGRPGLKSWCCHFLAMWPNTGYLASSCLRFFIKEWMS